jgi:hypothetical protein
VPTAALDAGFSVSVLLPLPGDARLAGAKLAVTPFGSPLTVSVIADLNPLTPAVDAVMGIDPPRDTVTLVPPSVSVKFAPTMVRLSACVLVTPAPDPVTVRPNEPLNVPLAAVSVSVLLPLPGDAMLLGEKVAVTPFGSPLTESAIVDLNPLIELVFRTTAVELPEVTVALAEFAVSVKDGTTIVKLSVCVCVSPPPVPFTVSVVAPPTALEAAFSVSVLLPLPGDAMLAGEKVAVTPFGSPLTDSAIAALNPFTAAVETVIELNPPAVPVALVALGVSVKLGASTVNAIGAVRVSPPPVPVTMMVELPATALLAALMVAVTGAAAVSAEEENFTVTPAGAALEVSVTGEANPPCAVSVIVAEPELPCAIDTLETLGVSVKFEVLALPQ